MPILEELKTILTAVFENLVCSRFSFPVIDQRVSNHSISSSRDEKQEVTKVIIYVESPIAGSVPWLMETTDHTDMVSRGIVRFINGERNLL